MERKYKTLEIEIGRPLRDDESRLIEELQAEFSDRDFFINTKDSRVIVNIRSVDLNRLRECADRLTRTSGLDRDKSNLDRSILSLVVDRIDRIRSYGVRGGRRIYVGYDKDRKVQDRRDKAKRRGIYFYARDGNFSTRINEAPNELVNKIINGDSEKILKKLPDNCIDLIFTSPPYNFGLGYDTSEDGVDWNNYFQKLFSILDECVRVLKYGGRLIINIQPLFSDYIPSHHIISDFLMKRKLIWKGEILWEKHNYNCKYTAWGSWRSPSSPYLKYTWEFLEVFCKGTLLKKGRKEDIDIGADEFKAWVYAKWSIAPERNMKKYGHPAMFPEELAMKVLKLFSFRGDIVLDPFNGVGTTTVVAKKLGRRFIGIDISREYCEKAERRLREVSSTRRIFSESLQSH